VRATSTVYTDTIAGVCPRRRPLPHNILL
jgi:hypothetical protein